VFLRVFFFCFFYRNIQRLFSCTHLGPSVGIIMGVIFYASVGSGLTGRPGPDYLPVVTGAVVVAAAPAEVVVVVTPAASAVFSGGAVPGNAELCPGIEYCGRN